MPDVAYGSTVVVGAASGHIRISTSWVLTKFLADLDEKVDREMKHEQTHPDPQVQQTNAGKTSKTTGAPFMSKGAQPKITGTAWEALRVSVFEVDSNTAVSHGVPALDWVWCSGVGVIMLQLILAMLPWILDHDWVPFLITAAGNAFALCGASLPQWNQEKWSCPKEGGATVAITQGNGSRHAIVLLGKKKVGLDLEILARGTRTARSSFMTRIITAMLALLWVILLITVAGVSEHTWCKSYLHFASMILSSSALV